MVGSRGGQNFHEKNYCVWKPGTTALHFAISGDGAQYTEVAKVLLDAKADINIKDAVSAAFIG